ncbi:Unknown protein, partial [Striga hermonthica]
PYCFVIIITLSPPSAAVDNCRKIPSPLEAVHARPIATVSNRPRPRPARPVQLPAATPRTTARRPTSVRATSRHRDSHPASLSPIAHRLRTRSSRTPSPRRSRSAAPARARCPSVLPRSPASCASRSAPDAHTRVLPAPVRVPSVRSRVCPAPDASDQHARCPRLTRTSCLLHPTTETRAPCDRGPFD